MRSIGALLAFVAVQLVAAPVAVGLMRVIYPRPVDDPVELAAAKPDPQRSGR